MNYFLWFLLFLSVPILVHLFSFRRAKKLLFTNVRFIKLVSTETKSKTRLKQILILTSRLLAFSFLILSFIASFFQFEENGILGENSIGFVYLDNSSSAVGDGIGDETSTVESLIQGIPGQFGQFVTNDFAPFANRERTKNEIIDQLDETQVSYVRRELSEVLERMNQSSKAYFISDFEDSSMEDLERIRLDSTKTYRLLIKDAAARRNVYVDSVWVERDLDNYQNNLLRCILGRSANLTEGSIVVKLIDGSGRQVSSVVKRLQDDPMITFTLGISPETTQYQIQLSGDDVGYDNDFYFVLGKNRRPEILLLSHSENTYLENVFGNEELFELNITSPIDIDYQQLQNVDLVVLNDFDQFPNGLISQASKKSSVFIFPSDSVDAENYSREGLLTYRYSNGSELQQMQLVEGNLLMEGAFQSNDDISLPNAIGRYAVSNTHERLLTLRDGSTFLGKLVDQPLYFLLSPLMDAYTELPKHSIFLPIMYRVAEESINKNKRLCAYSGDFIEIDEFSSDIPPKVVSQDTELIPEFIRQNQKGYVKVPNNLKPGFYHILQEDDTVKSFGLNISKNESVFDGLSFDEIDDFFAASDHVEVISVFDELEGSALPTQEGNFLWKYALILAMMFLLVETLFHRYLK